MGKPLPNARLAALATLVVALLAAGAWAWYVDRNRPVAAARRVIDTLDKAHPGLTANELVPGLVRLGMSDGTYVDLRLDDTLARCAARRSDCSDAIDAAVADVEHALAATRSPDPATLRSMVVLEPVPGSRYGFVTQTLSAGLERRYALVLGHASTFVTRTIAARMNLDGDALRDAADARVAAGPVRLEALPDHPTLHRVMDGTDATANLLVPARMKDIAGQLHADAVLCAMPARGVLVVTTPDPAGRTLLETWLSGQLRSTPYDPAIAGVLRYDVATDRLTAAGP